jgi:hypothetical protein
MIKSKLNIFHINFKNFCSIENERINIMYSQLSKKFKLVSKRFCNHDTFISEFEVEDKITINIPIGLHVSVMYFSLI